MASPRARQRLLGLVAFVLAACTLFVLGGPLRAPASAAARAIASPFAAVLRGVTQPVGDVVASWFNYSDVVAENHRLEQELSQLRYDQELQGFDDQQLASVLSLERLPFLGALPTVTAATTAENQSDFDATIELDKGTDAGVLVGMPVVGAGGLVGVVTSSTPGGSTVTLLTEAGQSEGVTFGHGHTAVVRGQGPGSELQASFVVPGTPVHVGETFYTDGLQGGLYPAGIPVGVVAATSGAGAGTQEGVALRPLANLNQLAYVDVVLWEPGS